MDKKETLGENSGSKHLAQWIANHCIYCLMVALADTKRLYLIAGVTEVFFPTLLQLMLCVAMLGWGGGVGLGIIVK